MLKVNWDKLREENHLPKGYEDRTGVETIPVQALWVFRALWRKFSKSLTCDYVEGDMGVRKLLEKYFEMEAELRAWRTRRPLEIKKYHAVWRSATHGSGHYNEIEEIVTVMRRQKGDDEELVFFSEEIPSALLWNALVEGGWQRGPLPDEGYFEQSDPIAGDVDRVWLETID